MSYQGRLGAISALCFGLLSSSAVQASSISADGRYVAFYSLASNLVAGDSNSNYDIFVRDVQTGVTSRISLNSTGIEGNGASRFPSISADGRYVAFVSDANNLVAGDNNGVEDVFVRDLQRGVSTRISLDSVGIEGNGKSSAPSISADGRYVAFFSSASNLVAGDTNRTQDVFVRDTQTGITTRISLDSAGNEGNLGGASPSISADGRYVAFYSYASNLVAGDTNGVADVFMRDTQTGITTRISLDSIGIESNHHSFVPRISADGRYVVFSSAASNLVSGDNNGVMDVFMRDTQTGITSRISLDSVGIESNSLSYNEGISADGRFVTFVSDACNLVAGNHNDFGDVFVRDTQTGITTCISLNSAGIEGNANSYSSNISADGRYIVFDSYASNLVTGDTNSAEDVFMRDTQTGITALISLDPVGNQGTLGEVVEFFNINLLHYFITSSETEASAIDTGSAGTGWIRTGKTFKAGGSNAVCRFYGSQSPGPNSHFYTADAHECASLRQIQAETPDTQKRWNYEGLSFAASVPVNGICAVGSKPVYRAYNNGFSLGIDSNHRITTDLDAIQEVVNLGWKNEGVVMCAPI